MCNVLLVNPLSVLVMGSDMNVGGCVSAVSRALNGFYHPLLLLATEIHTPWLLSSTAGPAPACECQTSIFKYIYIYLHVYKYIYLHVFKYIYIYSYLNIYI